MEQIKLISDKLIELFPDNSIELDYEWGHKWMIKLINDAVDVDDLRNHLIALHPSFNASVLGVTTHLNYLKILYVSYN